MSKKFKVKLSDSLSITPIEVPEANKLFFSDSIYTSNSAPLMVKIAATHAGIITRNNGFYMPDKMRAGAMSFVQNYGKPVLLHHNSHDGDPVGRIKHAAYMDTSTGLAKKDSYLKDFMDPHVQFETKVALVDRLISDGLLDDPSYEGVGYIEIIAAITDSEAKEKILDNRYLTVSIGAETDAAVCSICKTDWTDSGEMCDHVPGHEYDGKQAFIIAGNLFYDEVSFVSTPADPHAKVIEISSADGNTMHTQSVACEDHKSSVKPVILDMYLEKDDKQFNVLDETVQAAFKIQDNKKEETKPMQKKLVEDSSKADIESIVTASVERIVAANEGINKEYVEFAATTQLSVIGDEKLGDTTEEDFDTAVVALVDFIKSVVDADEEALAKLKDEEKDSRLGLIEDIESKFKKTEDDTNDAVDDIQVLDPVAVFNAVEEVMEELELGDSKISPEKRKTLPKMSFCVPADKKVEGIKGFIPVPNLDYVRAAKKYVADSTMSDELKEAINKTLDKKEKVYAGDKKQPAETKAADIADMSDEELKTLSDKVLVAMKERELVDECLSCDASETSIADLEDKVVQANDQLSAVRNELKEAFKDTEEVNCLYADLLDTYSTSMSQVISDVAALKGDEEIKVEDLKKKTASELSDQFNSITDGVDFSKIATKVNDGTSNNPEGTVGDPSLQSGEDSYDAETIKAVGDTYTSILFAKGGVAANRYLDECRAKKLIPASLDALDK